jgi:RecJ-like exonuclease
MADYILVKTTCPDCNGSGFKPEIIDYIKYKSIAEKINPKRPTPFDLDCCQHCGGTGKILVRATSLMLT